MKRTVLALETSCDETAVAIVRLDAGWVLFTAGYLVEFQRFHPDLLFHPMSW